MILLLFILSSIPLIISIINLLTYPALIVSKIKSKRLVSIIVPARNEEQNIKGCIESILLQTYTNIEVIVVDDNSSDQTYEIVKQIKDKRLRIIKGKELPKNWRGKNWACNQGYLKSKGEYLLFIDADVRIKSPILESAIGELERSNLDLLSIFPTQKSRNIFSLLNTLNMMWFLLSFLPLDLIFRSKKKEFLAVIGQFMLFRRSSYEKVGGHTSVRDVPVEDLALGVKMKEQHLNVKSILGGNLIECEMYPTLKESILGLGRSFFYQFRNMELVFILILLLLFLTQLFPYFLLLTKFGNQAIFLIFMSLLNHLNILLLTNQSLLLLPLHFVQHLFMIVTSIYSFIGYKRKEVVWRGRNILS